MTPQLRDLRAAAQHLLDTLVAEQMPVGEGGRLYNAYWALHEEIHHDGLGKTDGAYLRAGRHCSVHGTDLVPPDRTPTTRRYCPQCPEGSTLGPPAGWTGIDE